jgi:NTE family protein
MRVLVRNLPLLLILVAAQLASAAVEPRQSVGLVLEGGGALGLAHVGVLQWLEEHHIPVDYVAGTSMGGLVAGTYATGMSPTEVRELITNIDWDAVIRGEIPFADLAFRRKEDQIAYPNYLEFGLKHGVNFPGGFNSGQQVGMILDHISLPYYNIQSFDELPIPFRCIATDLTTRDMHVFDDGSLSLALRSTMSIPGFFAPVRSDGHVFVDGGLLDNLPTDVARNMGAQYVLAVHLVTPKPRADEVLSSFTVLGESFSTITAATERRGMKLADEVVEVDVTKFSVMDYALGKEIIQKGYDAAQADAEALLKLSLDDADWQAYLARRQSRRRTQIPVPQFVKIDGTEPGMSPFVKHDLQIEAGKPIDEANLESQLTTLIGLGRYTSIDYSIVQQSGQYGLVIHAHQKEYAPPTVNPLVIVDGTELNSVRFGLGSRITFLDVGKPRAEVRTDILVGSTYLGDVEYYRPLGTSNWFVAPQFSALSEPIDIYNHNTPIAEYRGVDVNGQFDLGYLFDRFTEFRGGYQIGYLNYTPKIGDKELLPALSGRQGITDLRLISNHLDNAIIPTKGYSIGSMFQFFDTRPDAADQFPALQARVRWFEPVGEKNSVFLSGEGASTFGFDKTGVPPFTLGGVGRLSAYGQNEIFTNQYMLYQVGFLRSFYQLPPIVGDKAYFTVFGEIAKSWGTPEVSQVPMDVSAGVVVKTLFGPAYFGASWGDSGHHKLFFLFGRAF